MSDDNTPTVAPTAFQPYTGFIIVLVLYLGSMLGLSIYGGLLNKEGSTTSMYAKIRTHFFGDTGRGMERDRSKRLLLRLPCSHYVYRRLGGAAIFEHGHV